MIQQIVFIIVAWMAVFNTFAVENMKIEINGTTYAVETDNNTTAADIAAHAPFELSVEKYAGHEYFAALPFTPRGDAPTTSKLLAGHIYWWAPGNAFVINYADYDIAPYRNVHIGHIMDTDAMKQLTADKTATVRILK